MTQLELNSSGEVSVKDEFYITIGWKNIPMAEKICTFVDLEKILQLRLQNISANYLPKMQNIMDIQKEQNSFLPNFFGQFIRIRTLLTRSYAQKMPL